MSAKEPGPTPADSPNGEQAVQRDFRKGNINFDFLQPEGQLFDRRQAERVTRERRAGKREGKRGLFDRGRPPRPVGLVQVVLWAALFTVSILGSVWIVFLGQSVVWLLLLPFLLATLFWSLIMLVLLKARPR